MRMRHAARNRRPTNISLDPACLDEARELGINVSQACERGLVESIKEARAVRWLEENRGAIDGWNQYLETHGLPLAEYRLF